MKKVALLTAVAAIGLWAVSAQATLIPLSPFTGTTSESFESFPNYQTPEPVTYLSEGTKILDNAATITSANQDLVIYQLYPTAGFGLGSEYAPVQDGVKGLGLYSALDTGTITFASNINAIGGYWGANTFAPTITFTFYEGATQVGTDTLNYAGGSSLTWDGWFSTVPFDKFTFSGDSVAVDSLQSDAQPVPEPASATAMLLSVALLGVRRCRA